MTWRPLIGSGRLSGHEVRNCFDGESFDLVFLVVGVREDELEVIKAEVRGESFIAKHVGDELCLLVLEDPDFLFHGIAGE